MTMAAPPAAAEPGERFVIGGTNGRTVTVKLPVARKLSGGGSSRFVAVQVTVVTPTGNVEPVNGEQKAPIGKPRPETVA